MVNPDHYAQCGFALELLAKSEYHRQHKLGNLFRAAVLPPLWLKQARFYMTKEGVPTAMVTWAWVSAQVETEIHSTGRDLAEDEWQCGSRLYFSDWITPYGNVREIARDMTHNVFPNETATSLRRNLDASVRRVNRWTGINLRKATQEEMA